MNFDHVPDLQPQWQALQTHYQLAKNWHMRDLFKGDQERFNKYSLNAAGLLLDFSKNIINDETLTQLINLARESDMEVAIRKLFAGENVNSSEQKPALHTALRAPDDEPPIYIGKLNIIAEVHKTLAQMEKFVTQLSSGKWTGYNGKAIKKIVHLGIGGSYLGPKLVADALKPYWTNQIDCSFVANIDGNDLLEKLNHSQPSETLFIIASKSFRTQETLQNAETARQWYLDNSGSRNDVDKHFIAITANNTDAIKFGIAKKNIFPMWDWVGGRYSLWSAIGLPLAILIGMDNFRALLKGARKMDKHFSSAPLEKNMPVLLALIHLWYINFFGADSRAIIPYDHFLRTLPAHIQQLEMESNGKSVSLSGAKINYRTGSIIWGGVGANGQHAYHQLLHQGTHCLPVDFIVPIKSQCHLGQHHSMLYANCLSQSQALMHGSTLAEVTLSLKEQGLNDEEIKELAPHKVVQGNHPSNTIVYEKTDPETVGALVALYEHKVYVNSVLWDINPFDQWGVELGKTLSSRVLKNLNEKTLPENTDSSTFGLINAFLASHSR